VVKKFQIKDYFMNSLFFSYSHKDEELRNELDKHLSIFGHSKSINFSYGITNYRNSLNESLSVAEDGFQLYLNKLGFAMSRNAGEKLTFEGAAEYYWEIFIKRLQN
jgi:hypothetical protein